MADRKFSAQLIEKGAQGLKALAKKPRTQFTVRETVEALFDDIEAALQNHGYAEVAAQLQQDGISIAKGTLKNYFLEIQRERSGNKKKTKTVTKHIRNTSSKITTVKQKTVTTNAEGKKTSGPPPDTDEIKLAY